MAVTKNLFDNETIPSFMTARKPSSSITEETPTGKITRFFYDEPQQKTPKITPQTKTNKVVPNLLDEQPKSKVIPSLFDDTVNKISEKPSDFRIDVPRISATPEVPKNPIQMFSDSVKKFYKPDMTKMQMIDEMSKEFELPREEISKNFDDFARKKAMATGVATQPTNEEFMNGIMTATIPLAASIMGPLSLIKGLAAYTGIKETSERTVLPAVRAIYQGLNQEPIKYEVTKLRELMPDIGPVRNIADLAEFVIYGKGAHGLIGSSKGAGTGLTRIARQKGITEPRIAGEIAGVRYRILKSLGVKQPTALAPLSDAQIKEAFGQKAWKYLSKESQAQWIREEKAKRAINPTMKTEFEKWRIRRIAEMKKEKQYKPKPKIRAVPEAQEIKPVETEKTQVEQKPQAILVAEKVGKVIGIDSESKLPIIDTKTTSQEKSSGGAESVQKEVSKRAEPTVLKPATETVENRPVKVSGEEKESTAFKRVQDRLSDARRMAYPGEEAEGVLSETEAKYNQMNLAEDTARAIRLVSEQPELARKIAYGIEPPPQGVTETAVSIAYSESMREAGNWKEMADSERSRSLRQTRRGQEIVAERGRANENSPEHFLMQVFKARLEKAGRSLFPEIKIGKSEPQTLTAKATQRIRQSSENIKKQVITKKMEIDEAQKILDSLIC